MSDSELIDQIVKRQPDALAHLYDRYSTAVYSLFLRTCRDSGTAEDLVQELFLRVWNRAQYFDPAKGSLSVWILSIARNMAIDYARSARARFATKLRPVEEAELNADSSKAAANQAETAIDDIRAIQAAFSYLNQKQKEVLELAYLEGLSQTEIARKLDEPLGTVKSWMRSALLRMRQAMQAGGAK